MSGTSRTLRAFLLLMTWSVPTLAVAPAVGEPLPLRFQRVSIDQGLSQSIVECIAQDPRGFMWFGTEDGLNVWDGYRFDVLRPTPGRAGGISTNSIVSLFLDRQGYLWIGTFNGGLNRYDYRTGQIVAYRNDPRNPRSLGHDLVRSILQDRRGTLWVGTDGGGLNRLDPSRGSFTVYRHDPRNPRSLGSDSVYALFEDSRGILWVGTRGGGLNRFDPADGSFQRYRHDPSRDDSLAHDDVYAVLEDRKGRFWVGTQGGGLDRMDRTAGTFRHFRHDPADDGSIGGDLVSALYEDRAGRLWVGTNGGGLNLFHVSCGCFVRYRNDPRDPGSLSRNEVRAIFEDAGGMLWVSTYGGGLNVCDPGRKAFYLFQSQPGNPDSLSNDIVWSFYEDTARGCVWIGTHGGGLDRFDPVARTWRHHRSGAGTPRPLSSDRIRVICPDPSGVFWIGTDGGGLNRFNPDTGEAVAYLNDPSAPGSLCHNQIRALAVDRFGKVWVGTFGGGLDCLDPATGVFTHYRYDARDPGTLGNDVVRAVHEDRRGRLWVATHGGGLNLLDRATGRFRRYLANPGGRNTLSSNFIFAIHEDDEGFLWLGTWGAGLNRFDPRDGSAEVFTTDDGLPSNSIYGILRDASGNLWMSTNNGISRFDPLRRVFRNYSESDGLQSNEFNGGAFHRGHSGRMYFGGIHGFNLFLPLEIRDNPHVPPVAVTRFLKLNRPVETPLPITQMTELEIGPDDYYITLEFSALDFASPAKNRYAYRMEGLDPDWITVDAGRRHASYTNLEPGTYTFRVRACNNDDVWNETGASVRVVVHPPFWKTWWFRTLVILASVVILTLTGLEYQSRHREKVRLRTLERELDVAETIQRSMLPAGYPAFPGRTDVDVFAEQKPARHVGGDFYDYYFVSPQRLAFAIGDVSGKGVPAAMQMSMCRVLIKGAAMAGRPPRDVARVVNETLLKELASSTTFITVFFGILDLLTGRLDFVRAGHNPPTLLRNDGSVELLTEPGNVFLGIFPSVAFEQGETVVEKGDTLILHTDGITEAEDVHGRFFDDAERRLEQELLALARRPLTELVRGIMASVETFTAGAPQSDDRTLLGIRRL